MNDLISRQAAIAAADRADCTELAVEDVKKVTDEVVKEIKKLPSAQSERLTDDDFETIRIHLSAFKEDLCNQYRWKEAEDYERLISRFMSFASAHQWTPCNERLPEEYGNYLITTHDGNVDIGTIDPKKKSVWSACDADGFYWLREVVAWMPLPEPYERKES